MWSCPLVRCKWAWRWQGCCSAWAAACLPFWPARSFGADLRSALFHKVQSLSFGNLDRLETGALITRLTNDVTQVTELVMMLLRVMVRVPMLMLGGLIMAMLTSPQLSLIFVVLIPVVLIALIVIINKTFPMFGEVQRRLDALNTVLQENLAGVRVIKAFARAAPRDRALWPRQRRPDGAKHHCRARGRHDHAADDADTQCGSGGRAVVRWLRMHRR